METIKTIGFKKNLPNIISGFRLIGALILPFLMWRSWERTITLPLVNRTFFNVPIVWILFYLFLLCTDKIDGVLARKLKVESEVGAAIDAVADVLVLAIGATLCFVWFVRESLETWQFQLYIVFMIICVINRVLVFVLAYIYHGKANATHSIFQKSFAGGTYIAIFFWAFLRTIPAWTIYTLVAISIYATIDESIYCARTAEYKINFKGHGFEKYKVRPKKKNVLK